MLTARLATWLLDPWLDTPSVTASAGARRHARPRTPGPAKGAAEALLRHGRRAAPPPVSSPQAHWSWPEFHARVRADTVFLAEVREELLALYAAGGPAALAPWARALWTRVQAALGHPGLDPVAARRLAVPPLGPCCPAAGAAAPTPGLGAEECWVAWALDAVRAAVVSRWMWRALDADATLTCAGPEVRPPPAADDHPLVRQMRDFLLRPAPAGPRLQPRSYAERARARLGAWDKLEPAGRTAGWTDLLLGPWVGAIELCAGAGGPGHTVLSNLCLRPYWDTVLLLVGLDPRATVWPQAPPPLPTTDPAHDEEEEEEEGEEDEEDEELLPDCAADEQGDGARPWRLRAAAMELEWQAGAVTSPDGLWDFVCRVAALDEEARLRPPSPRAGSRLRRRTAAVSEDTWATEAPGASGDPALLRTYLLGAQACLAAYVVLPLPGLFGSPPGREGGAFDPGWAPAVQRALWAWAASRPPETRDPLVRRGTVLLAEALVPAAAYPCARVRQAEDPETLVAASLDLYQLEARPLVHETLPRRLVDSAFHTLGAALRSPPGAALPVDPLAPALLDVPELLPADQRALATHALRRALATTLAHYAVSWATEPLLPPPTAQDMGLALRSDVDRGPRRLGPTLSFAVVVQLAAMRTPRPPPARGPPLPYGEALLSLPSSTMLDLGPWALFLARPDAQPPWRPFAAADPALVACAVALHRLYLPRSAGPT